MLFTKTKIERIAAHRGVLSAFPSEHLLFSVEGGFGQLRFAGRENQLKKDAVYDEHSACALLLGDTPLVQIQSSGCPTCESLLAAGYGIPEDSRAVQEMRRAMKQPYAGLEDALERLRPLLALLPSGVYVLTESAYCPTNGEGRFFWDVPEAFTAYQATAQYYDSRNFRVLPSFPLFLYPTQGAQKYDACQVKRYRTQIREGKPLSPVLAYALDASMSVLLDGHHRASACALEGVRAPGLTISRPGRCWRERGPYLVWPDECETAVAQLLPAGRLKRLEGAAGQWRSIQVPVAGQPVSFRRPWEAEYARMAHYPTWCEAGVLALYPDLELSPQGIRMLAMDDDYEQEDLAAQLLHYAARQPGVKQKELAMAFIEPGYPAGLRRAAFEVLDSIKDDPEIDDIMVEILVYCERKDDPIYKIANGHWDP